MFFETKRRGEGEDNEKNSIENYSSALDEKRRAVVKENTSDEGNQWEWKIWHLKFYDQISII